MANKKLKRILVVTYPGYFIDGNDCFNVSANVLKMIKETGVVVLPKGATYSVEEIDEVRCEDFSEEPCEDESVIEPWKENEYNTSHSNITTTELKKSSGADIDGDDDFILVALNSSLKGEE